MTSAPVPQISHRERVAQLLDQADQNEADNLAANEKQVEAANKFQSFQDERDAERATATAESAPEVPNPRDPAVMKAQKAFREAQFSGKTVGDMEPGNNRRVQGTPAQATVDQ
jgi:alpha-acetolactate decarboxylase